MARTGYMLFIIVTRYEYIKRTARNNRLILLVMQTVTAGHITRYSVAEQATASETDRAMP